MFKYKNLVFIAVFFFLLPVSISAWAEAPKNAFSNNPVVAEVDGQPIMLDDLKNAKIQDTLVNLHQLQKGLLKQKVLQILRKKHPEMKKENIPQATRKDVENFYHKTPGIKEIGTFEEMESEIRQFLEATLKDSYYESQYETALQKGWVKDYFEAPNDFTVVASLGTAALWFSEDAAKSRPIIVLEYSDFQCPFCKRVQGTIKKLRQRYASQVQFGYRHFPLPFHKEATQLAEATECAREQGRFWEMQAVIYENAPQTITRDAIFDYARQAGVRDAETFEACSISGKYKARVNRDVAVGVRLGIVGTPTFVVGLYNPDKKTLAGEMFSGAVSENDFIQKIEKYLALSEQTGPLSSLAKTP